MSHDPEPKQQETKPNHATCNYTWGHCDGRVHINFGRPSSTPHVCGIVPRHIRKLHRCVNCGSFGHRITPTKISQAGREVTAILAAIEKLKALKAQTPTTPEVAAGNSF